ncbi:acyl-CoA dehydrogenase [Campylobacterota bacterium]|nr:acyl-CoA dehydrogenase [Campylobacterota bacterium]
MSRYEEVRAFAKKSVEPYTTAADKEGRFPKESFEALRQAGYFSLLVPKEFGGQGGSMADHTEVCLALAESCATTALCYMMHNVATQSIVASATEAMKKDKLPQIAQGKKIMALAFSESGSGTHFYLPEIAAKKEGDKFILNGRKSFVTTARFADEYLVDANAIGAEGLDIWSVPLGADGISFEDAAWDGLGMRGNNSMPMVLNGVTLGERDRIGAAGAGGDSLNNVIAPFFVIGLAAVYSGVATAAQNTAIEYAKSRKYPDGSVIAEIPTVQEHLAKIYYLTQSARHFTIAAAQKGASAAADLFAARINASENAVEVCRLAMKVGGGNAYAKRLPLERYLRDAYAAAVMAPSTDVLAIWLGQALSK